MNQQGKLATELFNGRFHGRNILITGGMGFISSNLARRLVALGAMYTQGVGGTQVGVIQSGSDRSARYSFDIPDNLKQSSRISIRAQTSHAKPYYAYNWFSNFTTTGDQCN